MSSKYYIGSVNGDPTQDGKMRDEVNSAFLLAETDVLASVEIVDKSGSGPASGGTVTLTKAVTGIYGALVLDASGAGVLLWRPASVFTLAATGLTITNEAVDYNAAGDTFVLFLKPKITEPS